MPTIQHNGDQSKLMSGLLITCITILSNMAIPKGARLSLFAFSPFCGEQGLSIELGIFRRKRIGRGMIV